MTRTACARHWEKGGVGFIVRPSDTSSCSLPTHELPKGMAHLPSCFPTVESPCGRDAVKGKTTAIRSKGSHLYDFCSAIPDLEASSVNQSQEGQPARCPSDLLLPGKVLAATKLAVGPSICCRCGVAEQRPSWQTG